MSSRDALAGIGIFLDFQLEIGQEFSRALDFWTAMPPPIRLLPPYPSPLTQSCIRCFNTSTQNNRPRSLLPNPRSPQNSNTNAKKSPFNLQNLNIKPRIGPSSSDPDPFAFSAIKRPDSYGASRS